MNILIISLAFAPYSGVGAARMTSLSKYLTLKGEKVTVICYDSKVFGEKEQEREIPSNVRRIIVDKSNRKWNNIRHLENQVRQIIAKEKFDLCIMSVGPYDTMFFAHKIKKYWNIPYIIDYRDPWLYEKSKILPKGWRKYKIVLKDMILSGVEKRNIKWADKIVLVTKRCQQDIVSRYGLADSKSTVIYNGYEEFPKIKNKRTSQTITFAIAGKFSYYNEKAANDFLTVCNKMTTELNIKLIHIGNAEKELSEKYLDVFVERGNKNYSETMCELQKADVMLITYAHTSGLGTKVFDYIALNKPVIYVGVVPSELADFLIQFENAYICSSKEEIETAIRAIAENVDTPLTDIINIDSFSRDYQNGLYYSLMKQIVH